MKVVVFGASGNIGSVITDELLSRGHEVTGVTRTGVLEGADRPGLTVRAGDVTDPDAVAELVKGHDAVASAVGPKVGVENDAVILVGAARTLITILRKSEVTRIVVLGGAGSLDVDHGVRLIDTPGFPAMWKNNALAQGEVLALYRDVDDLDWTFISPPALIEPGRRTEVYRVGDDDRLLVDAEGRSRISIADYAVAFVDELEHGDAVRRRITVAY